MTGLTHGHLLGGRVRYAQRTDGYRTGIEPVLLAASVPAQPGQRVLEAGTGAGAGLLCLGWRVPGLQLVGLELDPRLAALARENLAANGLVGEVLVGDVASAALNPADHVFANPPWHDWRATASPDALRRRAKQAGAETLRVWIERLAACVRPNGSLTLALPAAQAEAAGALLDAAALPDRSVLWLLPKPGRPFKLALIRARCGPAQITHGQRVLHEPSGAFTIPMRRVLWDAEPLEWGTI